ncbi:uncharacterized protein SPSK_03381 [Sporothrix schenckii 1099-18]|uniref:UBC core domain-containing protein n=2 Tax=Sporothrix schenckii TaxID=29908 RepID=U7PSH6_SPOS1|nr:uncharacterized protein SPSK_03381 [Sporothrix schenckii 1099-18]ERS97709.1 hypothetical protein HMPREF1624_05880 [Sporothrix schenckii ATCC 58251]KJR82241.1 hypothetical protein SPSK_03381 [Sporothrix schenckii 1099-18]
MATSRFTSLPALRRQNLFAEFSGLKQACPEGVFMTLTPGDPSLWSGVIFVRDGPYAPAVLRFQISFPDSYPSLPPLVTFATDIFHPLITPLTTYTYTTDIQDNGTVSATDEERLPPGGFSLRHGFPAWFGRGNRNKRLSGQQQLQSQAQSQSQSQGQPSSSPSSSPLRPQTPPRSMVPTGSAQNTPTPSSTVSGVSPSGGTRSGQSQRSSFTPTHPTPSYLLTEPPAGPTVSTYDVLQYIRSTFDDADVLDDIPLEAAGNPGAWNAWRTHRHQAQKETANRDAAGSHAATAQTSLPPPPPPPPQKPGEWNWEHVWEERVKKGINTSLSEPVLFGSAGAADDVIRFLSMDDSEIEAVKDNLKRTLGAEVS